MIELGVPLGQGYALGMPAIPPARALRTIALSGHSPVR
jgi:hypothetical protein